MAVDKLGLRKITNEVSDRIRDVLGSKLCKILLFGSYARGDNHDESDIDIMVLADVDDKDEFQRMEKTVWNIGWKIGSQHDIMVCVFLHDNSHFYEWLAALAFYRNVAQDGVVLYES